MPIPVDVNVPVVPELSGSIDASVDTGSGIRQNVKRFLEVSDHGSPNSVGNA